MLGLPASSPTSPHVTVVASTVLYNGQRCYCCKRVSPSPWSQAWRDDKTLLRVRMETTRSHPPMMLGLRVRHSQTSTAQRSHQPPDIHEWIRWRANFQLHQTGNAPCQTCEWSFQKGI